MDKEAEEKMVNELALELEVRIGGWQFNRQELKDMSRLIIIALGYRKLPKDELPLLSDREIVDAWLTGAGVPRDERGGIDLRDVPQRHRQIAQAQREADIKFYS